MISVDMFSGQEGFCLLATEIVDRFSRRGVTLGVGESCTGGLLAGALTEIPGASAVFLGGIVSYSNGIKGSLLGVPEEVFQRFGAVSESCVRAMAAGARQCLGVDVALAVTGIAGPEGGSSDKPVGTIWFALADSREVSAWVCRFSGNRRSVRLQSVQQALEALLRWVDHRENRIPEALS